MSNITTYPPSTPIRHTVPGGWVTKVGGRAHEDRSSCRLDARTNQSDVYSKARRLAERRADPDLTVTGCVIPFDTRLPGNGDAVLLFDADTEFRLPDDHVLLQLEHGHGHLGVVRVIEIGSGLYIDGSLHASRRRAAGDRRELSVGLDDVQIRRRADGVLQVTSATLREISLVAHARWSPYTYATLTPSVT